MFCAKCGHESSDGQKFCTSCGAPMDGSAFVTEAGHSPVGGGDGTMPSHGSSLWNKILKKKWSIIQVLVGIAIGVGYIVYHEWNSSVERQAGKLFEETIKEEFLGKMEFDEYIALDKIENFSIKQVEHAFTFKTNIVKFANVVITNSYFNQNYDPFLGKKWSGTADVTFKTKRGKEMAMTAVYQISVMETETQLRLNCEPKNGERFNREFGDLLEKAGYEEK